MGFPQTVLASASPEAQMNDNFRGLGALGTYSHYPPTDSGLTRGYSGGRWGGFTVADSTHAFAANATHYVSVNRATGALDYQTTAANYNDAVNYAKVETIVIPAAVTAILDSYVTDDRSGPGGVHGGPSGTGATNRFATTTKTAAYTAVSGDNVILANTGSASFSVTLPVAPIQGEVKNIKKISASNTLTIDRNGKNIDGAATSLSITANNQNTQLVYDVTFGWAVL